MMKVDMSPEAITGRMLMVDQLWELAVAVKNSKIGPRVDASPDELKAVRVKKSYTARRRLSDPARTVANAKTTSVVD